MKVIKGVSAYSKIVILGYEQHSYKEPYNFICVIFMINATGDAINKEAI